ncbi:MAG TPA: NADH-quinone oxidoreductase subunit J [Propionicimonas sp.]|nr:NADH-quinone oxidoreductase subunit J [Propionicimonas sp.]HRA07249.1 NADH-quinone oxidoreductase subunit J [Propionicimonas sp.]
MIPLVTGAEVTFWIVAPLMVLGSLGLLVFRKAVYAALSMAFVMINLAVLYASLDAMFLTFVQIIVYTGAIMMLFLFVLMLVGVGHTADSLVETIPGQRWLAGLAGLGLLGLILFGIGGSLVGGPRIGLDEANAAHGGNVESLAALIFGRYVFVFELTSALLITAAVGAMVLGQHFRVRPRPTQPELAEKRMRDYAGKGTHPGSLPNSGVLANHNSIATPALLPDGSVSEASVSKTLAGRGVIVDAPAASLATARAFESIESHQGEEDE